MSIQMSDLSSTAQSILTAALSSEGREKGLVTSNPSHGGGIRVTAGVSARPGNGSAAYGEDAALLKQAINVLVDERLMVPFTLNGVPAGFMVTPLGTDVAAVVH